MTQGLAGRAPDDVVAVMGESLGALAQATSALPPALAETVASVANQSFVDAIGVGLLAGIGIVGLAIVIALLAVPFKMRTDQAELEDAVLTVANDPAV